MTKQQQIKNWQSSATESWISAVYLALGEHFTLSLFALNLSIEKILKAIWIKESATDTPPNTHDLQKLVKDIGLDFEPEDYDFLSVVNSWNIHEDYAGHTSYTYSTADYLQNQIDKIYDLRISLEKRI